ncbi:MAG: AMP-binding protein [Blastocatellia bacterium]
MSKFMDEPNINTIINILNQRAENTPEKVIYTYLVDGENQQQTLTCGELREKTKAISVYIQRYVKAGERALMFYPPGLEFIPAFFACLASKIIAVPLPPPNLSNPERALSRLQTIIVNANPSLALMPSSMLAKMKDIAIEIPMVKNILMLSTDDIDLTLANEYKPLEIEQKELAYLQYTSGSTSEPKGVMISHDNILHNCKMIKTLHIFKDNSVSLTWMPNFHDFGLVDGIISNLYSEIPVVFLSPLAFLQKPVRWLKAVPKFKVTHTGAPNFAYELCLRKITEDQLEGLDLSTLKDVNNAAEPVRKETVENFIQKFSPYGFQRNAMHPAYGLAESTLVITSAYENDEREPLYVYLDRSALEKHEVVYVDSTHPNHTVITGCGKSTEDVNLLIVNPETLEVCLENRVGEIWVSSQSVALGYWNNLAETEKNFKAYLANNKEVAYLRTGDLGFLKEGELFVTGRLKDMLIIRGQNYYPQDLERILEKSHPALRLGCSAVFFIQSNGEELICVVVEIESDHLSSLFHTQSSLSVDLSTQFSINKEVTESIFSAIRQAVSKEFELQVYGISLIKPGTILKTSSGKIRRQACKEAFINNKLSEIDRSLLEFTTLDIDENISIKRDSIAVLPDIEKEKLLKMYILQQVNRIMKISVNNLQQQPLSALGLDSVMAVELKTCLEKDLEISPSITDLLDLAIEDLIKNIIEEINNNLNQNTNKLPEIKPILRNRKP